MNKQIVKQLMDIVLFLKQASASGGGMHPGGGAYPPKKVAPKPGMHPGGGGYSSREKRQYDPKGPHEGPRKGHYYKPGEREVGGVQVDMVQAPETTKRGKSTYEPEAKGITVQYQSTKGQFQQQITGITDPEAAKEEFIRRHSNNSDFQDDTAPMKDNSEGFSLKDKNGDWLQYNDIVKSIPSSNEEKLINTIDFYIQQR